MFFGSSMHLFIVLFMKVDVFRALILLVGTDGMVYLIVQNGLLFSVFF